MPTVKPYLPVQFVWKIESMNSIKKSKSIVGGVKSNEFVTYMIIKKVDISMSENNIIYDIKKSYYRKIM